MLATALAACGSATTVRASTSLELRIRSEWVAQLVRQHREELVFCWSAASSSPLLFLRGPCGRPPEWKYAEVAQTP